MLGIKVEFFRINEKEDITFATFGDTFELTIRFGYFEKEKVFGYVSHLPIKQEEQVNK